MEALVNALPPQDPIALRLLRAAELKNPSDFWVNFTISQRLANYFSDNFETDRARRRAAIGYMQTAAAIRPESMAPTVILGLLHAKENNPDEIDKVADRLARWDRESPFKSFILAKAAVNRQQYQEAIGHLQHAIELEPANRRSDMNSPHST